MRVGSLIKQWQAFSQRGTGKPRNQDAVLLNGQVCQGSVRQCGRLTGAGPFTFAVADGVSGGANPRLASRLLLEMLTTRLLSCPSAKALGPLLHQLHHDYAQLGSQPAYFGMASTLVGVCLEGSRATVFNVGDSRAYVFTPSGTGHHVQLLSHDHSLLQEMIDAGDLAPEQATEAASFVRGLTSQLMAAPVDLNADPHGGFQVSITHHVLQKGEILVLCSDGLNEALSDSEMAALFCEPNPLDLTTVYRAARRAGGTDDFSVVVLET